GLMNVLLLNRHRGHVVLSRGLLLASGRPHVDAAVAAVVADAGHVGGVVHDGGVVDVVDFGHVDVVHAPVVVKPVTLPAPAVVAEAKVAVAVIHAAVEANVPAPVAVMEYVDSFTPSPPGRRPKISDPGRAHPGARHPVVVAVVRVPGPVSRG